MPYLQQKIDAFSFISLQGQIVPPMQVKLADDRAGVDGTEFVLAGKKGQPFVLISQVDEDTGITASSLFDSYLDLIDYGSVNVIKDGISTQSRGFKCSVLSVRQMDLRVITGAAGNKHSNSSNAFLVAEWTLVSVPIGS